MKICNDTFNAETPELASIFQRWPFALSDFQKFAIDGILNGKHVIITAHTGNGKTLPADFAISHFTRIGKKVIYTSPIKALTNQKYNTFSEKYPWCKKKSKILGIRYFSSNAYEKSSHACYAF